MKQRIDLNNLAQIVFDDIDVLFNSLGIGYSCIGDNCFCCCPVHAASDNPTAVSIYMSNKSWHCWTRGCHEEWGRDIFSFVRGALTNRAGVEVSFADTLKHIRGAYNLNGSLPTKPFRPLQHINFAETFIDPIPLSLHCPYFEGRGFSRATLIYFGVGEYKGSERHLKHRAMIPVHNKDGKLVRYICRATKPYIKPKFIWSKKGFKKKEYLYNLHRAAHDISRTNSAFLVEGTGDVWRLYEAGVDNAICPFGKEVSEQQKTIMLDTGIKNLVVLLDDDQPGREAKFKIQRELCNVFNLVFPALKKKDIGAYTAREINQFILPQVKDFV